jgi:hypothetical protein
MVQEEMDYLIVSRLDYKKSGFKKSNYNPVGSMVRIHDYKENPWWNDYTYGKEVFEELLGKDFGKKDFYYEPKTWGFIIEALENKIREVLKTMKKVPQEHLQNPTEYLRTYKLENDDFYTGNRVFYEDIEDFLAELYHYNSFRHNEKGLYNFNLLYNILKKNYDESYPLYISGATVEDQKKYP